MSLIKEIVENANALGFKPVSDTKHRDLIFKGLTKKDGYCPCKFPKTSENLCPCEELRTTKHCTCGLFTPMEKKKG